MVVARAEDVVVCEVVMMAGGMVVSVVASVVMVVMVVAVTQVTVALVTLTVAVTATATAVARALAMEAERLADTLAGGAVDDKETVTAVVARAAAPRIEVATVTGTQADAKAVDKEVVRAVSTDMGWLGWESQVALTVEVTKEDAQAVTQGAAKDMVALALARRVALKAA